MVQQAIEKLKLVFASEIKGVILDCDGVIIDSLEANTEFYNIIRRHFGLGPISAEEQELTFKATVRESLTHILPNIAWADIARVAEAVNYERDVLPKLRLFADIKEFIEVLRQKGFLIAMHTNRTRNGITSVVDHFNLHGYFDLFVSAEDATPKPDSAGVLLILDKWQLAPEKVLFIGDSSHDQDAAKGAKVKFAAFRNLALKADFYITDFHSLIKNCF